MNGKNLTCVSTRTEKIMSICKQQSTSSEQKTTKKLIIRNENKTQTQAIITGNSLSNALPNRNLMLLDIPEVTDGIFKESELHTLTNWELLPLYEVPLGSNNTSHDKEHDKHSTAIEFALDHVVSVEEMENYENRSASDDPNFEPNNIEVHNSTAIDNIVTPTEDPDFIPDTELENHTANETIIRKRKKRQFVCTEDWNVNKKKIKREMGKEYEGRRKVKGKWKYDVKRGERKMKEPCNCKASIKDKSLKCRTITEDERKGIFIRFWSKMGWAERRLYVSFLIVSKPIQRSRNRVAEGISRRSESLEYYLKPNEASRIRVCKQMFLNTHCVKENMILDWLKKQNAQGSNITDPTPKDDNHPQLLENPELVQSGRYKDFKMRLTCFLKTLPKVESHYCRASSTKLYLEPNWQSKSSLYKFYRNWCQQKKDPYLSITSFHHVFDEMNLSLFRPKKDECDACAAHKTGNLSDEVFNLHQEKKKEARSEKSKDKASDNKVFCMDLQSVLLSPKSNVSSLYFKTKLIVHNFTFFDLSSSDGYCYIWHESAGGVTANDYTSIICQFINDHVKNDLQPDQTLILYSDGCTSQNRNSTLANALINLSISLNITIEQKFLEKGHTQTEADSMHSTIERAIRNTNIPADYVRLCMQAREKPRPYKVYYLGYGFFRDFPKPQFLTSLRPGKKIGDPVVTDLRALRYTSEGSLFYKLRHPNNFVEFEYSRLPKNKRKEIACKLDSYPALYDTPIPIKKREICALTVSEKKY